MKSISLFVFALLSAFSAAAPITENLDMAGIAYLLHSFGPPLQVGATCDETSTMVRSAIEKYQIYQDHECEFYNDQACTNLAFSVRGPKADTVRLPEAQMPVRVRCSRV